MGKQSKKTKVVEMPDEYPIQVQIPGKGLKTVKILSPDFAYRKLENLFEGNRPALLKAAMRILQDYHQAEDIVQKTLLGIYYTLTNGKLYAVKYTDNKFRLVKGGQFQPSEREQNDRRLIQSWLYGMEPDGLVVIDNPLAWIGTSLRNNACQRYAREKQRHQFETNTKNWELAQDPEYPNPEDIFFKKVRCEEIRALVATLPSRYRTIVELRYFEGRHFTDIAQIVGRPVKTVTKQSSRALEIIEGILTGRRVAKNGRYVPVREPA